MHTHYTIIFKHFLYIGETANIQWQNKYDEELKVECRDKKGYFGVVSKHDSDREDRLWQWNCQEVAKTPFTKCYWSKDWENAFNEPFLFQCPANYILNGVHSIHHNNYEDRRWKFRCCRAKNHFTRNCFASSFINDWGSMMDYKVDAPYVFTGVFSYYSKEEE